MGKRILGLILSFIMLFHLMPLSVLAQEGEASEVTYSYHTIADASCTDNADELYAAYAERLFYPDSAVFASAAGARLTGDEKILYDALVPMIQEIASGTRTSTILTVGQDVMYEDTLYPVDSEVVFNEGEMSDESLDRVMTALLSDLPYELYWYDKVTGCGISMFFDSVMVQAGMYFYVDASYQGADAYSVNGEKAGAAVSAVQNAQSIVDAYASSTDEEKLLGYRDEICTLVEYDFAAAEAGNFTTDCNPWQLIHVFDGDPATNVVCEGYSKAYMYLCDLTEFSGDIACYTVSGFMDGGAHMWNNVSIEGKNYLADVTNSDTGTYGEDGCLFMVGGTGSAAAGYTVSGISYTYDEDILDIWGTDSDSILTLEAEDYVFSAAPQPDASGTCGTGVFWRLDGDTLTIYGEGAMADYEEWSDTPWSAHTDSIVKVIITDGVTRIGNSAFGWCYYLADISVPDSVTSIGELAFEDCDSLTSIVLPKNLTEIGKYAFYGCTGLERIAIPNGVTVINDSVFSSCYSLSEITLPDGITSIGGSAFQGCRSLTGITIPDSVTSIAQGAFSGCSGLQSMTLPFVGNCVKKESDLFQYPFGYIFGTSAYTGGAATTQYYVGRNTDSLVSTTYYIPSGLTDVTITGGLLLKGAFYNCNNLTGVSFSSSNYNTIGANAFYGCTNLETVNLELALAIGSYAFYDCDNLRTIILPEYCLVIDHYAFSDCDNLTTVSIPADLIGFSEDSFESCHNLSEIYYGSTEEAWNALPNHPSVNFVHYETTDPEGHWVTTTVPATCDEDGYTDAVCGCGYKKDRVTFAASGHDYVDGVCTVCSETEPYANGTCGTGLYWKLDIFGTLTVWGNGAMTDYTYTGSNWEGSTAPWYTYHDRIEKLVIKDGVTSLGNYAFKGCTELTEVTMADSVTVIGAQAFALCSALETADLSENIDTIGYTAFAGCSELAEITVPAGVTAIPTRAFNDCIGLTEVNLPDSVTSIGNAAFSGCTGLTEIDLPDTLRSLGDNAFLGCTGLTEITIPNGVIAIGKWSFDGCTGLTEVTIPGSISEIPGWAFQNCTGLEQVTVGSGVSLIGDLAFGSCTNLTSVILPASVTRIELVAFYGCSVDDIYYGGTAVHWATLNYKPSADRVHYSVTTTEGHWSTETTLDPTCTSDGKTVSTCPCGHERITNVIPSPGHNYVDGTCSRCGEADPDAAHPMLETVTRVFGSNRYDTSFKSADTLKDLMGVDKFQNIIVASGANFPDALAGSYLASVKEAPILLVNNGTVESVKTYIRANLVPGGTVYLLGGTGVVPTSMETGLTGFTVKRLGGATRYDTNLQILLEAGIGDRDILVCTGTGFADSLSASAVGLPILLVGTSLTSAQRSLLSTCSGDIIIVGGWGAVSDYVASQLAAYGPVERLSGSTRYETSTLVAERFFDDPTNAVLAYAENFPDGLSGGPIANRIGAPLILTMSGRESAAASYTSRNGINHGIILGGPTLIGDKAIRSVFSLGSDVTIATR